MIAKMRFRQEKAEDIVGIVFQSRYCPTANVW